MNKRISPKTKTFTLALIGFLALAVLLILGCSVDGAGVLSAEVAADAEARVDFLLECGWETDPDSEQEQIIHIPEQFTDVFENYNQLQLQQGYDLSVYAGMDCALYTYTVINYPDPSQTVLANLYIYKNRIIGGDIHSTNLNGFMIGLK